MPDLIGVIIRRWKLIVGLTLLAAALAALITAFRTKEYLSTTTALPANSVTADKARLFNQNIEVLYSDFGTPDELDRLEGTAALDTIYLATVKKLQLAEHYEYGGGEEGLYKAVLRLRKNSRINRSAYGELKVKVWDKTPAVAAAIANNLMSELQSLHRHLQNEINRVALEQVREIYRNALAAKPEASSLIDTLSAPNPGALGSAPEWQELQRYRQMIREYELALQVNPPVLLIVEHARASLWPDKPDWLLTIGLSFFAGLLLSFLLALLLETRKRMA